MNNFPKILAILVVLVVLIYFSGGHGIFGRGLGLALLIYLIFLVYKRTRTKKSAPDNKPES